MHSPSDLKSALCCYDNDMRPTAFSESEVTLSAVLEPRWGMASERHLVWLSSSILGPYASPEGCDRARSNGQSIFHYLQKYVPAVSPLAFGAIS